VQHQRCRDGPGEVVVEIVPDAVVIRDSGIGMSPDELRACTSRSSADNGACAAATASG